jgi:hypothetical protein
VKILQEIFSVYEMSVIIRNGNVRIVLQFIGKVCSNFACPHFLIVPVLFVLVNELNLKLTGEFP